MTVDTIEKFDAMRAQHQDKTQPPAYKHAARYVCPRCYGPVYREGYPKHDTRDCVER